MRGRLLVITVLQESKVISELTGHKEKLFSSAKNGRSVNINQSLGVFNRNTMVLISSRSVEKTVFHSTGVLGPLLELQFLLLSGESYFLNKQKESTTVAGCYHCIYQAM